MKGDHSSTPHNPSRRDILTLATSAGAVTAVGGVAWPLIAQMNPDASARALASTEVDISTVPEGQIITVKWRGKPVFIRHRTEKEIKDAQAVSSTELPDPELTTSGFKNHSGWSSLEFARILDVSLPAKRASMMDGSAHAMVLPMTYRVEFDRGLLPITSKCQTIRSLATQK